MKNLDFLSSDWMEMAVAKISQMSPKNKYKQLNFDNDEQFIVKYVNEDGNKKIEHYQKWNKSELVSWSLNKMESPNLIIERDMKLEYDCWLGNPDSKAILYNSILSTFQKGSKSTIPPNSEVLHRIALGLEKVKYADFVVYFTIIDFPWCNSFNYYVQFVNGIPEKSWIDEEENNFDTKHVGLKCKFSGALSYLFGISEIRDIDCEFLGNFIEISVLTGIMSKPRIGKTFESVENVLLPYLSLISRMETLDFNIVRNELSSL